MDNGNKINLTFTNSGARKTQTSAVLNWLKSRNRLTRWEAMIELGIGDLPRVIRKIRKAGVDVFTEMIKHKGHYGSTKYAKYHFIKEAPEEENKEGDV